MQFFTIQTTRLASREGVEPPGRSESIADWQVQSLATYIVYTVQQRQTFDQSLRADCPRGKTKASADGLAKGAADV